MRRLAFVLLFLAVPAFAQYDDLVNATFQQWKLPGLAVVVVQNDRVVYLKVMGVKDIDKRDPIRPDTLFELGSTTKAFTTTAIAMLIDEKKMNWDDPVRKYLPYFHLSDPCADGTVAMRDLVTHRTGVSAHDDVWDFNPNDSRADVIKALGTFALSKPIRTAFQYNNVMFVAAGEAAGAAAGMSWDDLVRTRIFEPLGMTHTRIAATDFEAADHATGYNYDSKADRWVPHPFLDYNDIAPAGTIKSCATDMAQWLRFQLANGAIGDKRLLSADALQETKTPQIDLRIAPAAHDFYAGTNFLMYAMGWNVQDYRGNVLIAHGGALNGYRSQVALLPAKNAGIAIMTNIGRGFALFALRNAILDRLLGAEDRDWNANILGYESHANAMAETQKQQRASKRHPNTHPSRELETYAGTYVNPGYGPAIVTLENGALALRYGRLHAPLTHVQFDTFNFNIPEEDLDEDVQFQLDTNGEIATLTLFGEMFKKEEAGRMKDDSKR